MDLLRRITKKTAVVIAVSAAIAAAAGSKEWAAGILTGGILGVVNLRGLTRSVEGLIGTARPTGKMIFFSIFRLAMLCVILGALVYLKAVNVFGLLIGFTILFTVLVAEGLRYAKESQADSID